jgi:anti-sigma factor RsiW
MTTYDQTPERQDIEALLPWHAAGTLEDRDAQRVDAALAQDRELARRYALVREELAATVRLNDALGAPPAGAMERLMVRIDAESPAARGRPALGGLTDWVAAQVGRLSPRALAFSVGAALVVIIVQAALLATFSVTRYDPAGFQTASVPRSGEIGIGFVPAASAADITKFLESYHLTIIDGPRPGGLFMTRPETTPLPKDGLDRLVRRIQEESRIVRFAAVEQ